MLIRCKAIVARASVLLVTVLGTSSFPGPLVSQQGSRSAAPKFPEACFFFEPGSFDFTGDKVIPEEERAYTASADHVHHLWFTPNASTPQQRSDAADAMVVAWRRLWDRDTPFNAVFHESGSIDLLALLGVTHELPTLMRTDAQFTNDWIKDCSYACFHLNYEPGLSASGRFTLMQLWLRNDVLDNLKKEPAAEPVLKMLSDATFTLVD